MLEFNELTALLLQNGMYIEVILIIYTLPVLITIVNFFKYIIGTKTIGTYASILIIYIFWSIAGIKTSLVSFDLISIVTNEIVITFLLLFTLFSSISFFYSLLYKIKLHYLPKISTVLIFALISLILLFWASTKLDFNYLEAITPLSIILLVVVSEQFLGVYIKNDLNKAVYLSLETFFISVVCYLIIIQPILLNLLLSNPWIILLTLPLNIIIGKFTGLRLTEYIRFYELLAQSKNEHNRNTEE